MTPVGPSQTPDSVFGNSAPHYSAGRKVFFAGEPVPHRADADFNITFDASNAANTRVPLWVCYFREILFVYCNQPGGQSSDICGTTVIAIQAERFHPAQTRRAK
jgi:hypothetical protein